MSWSGDGLPPPDGAALPVALSIRRGHAWTLSFVAGFVDTCVFIALFGLFTAHVTGNLVLIGSELVHNAPADAYPKLLAFASFVGAVIVAVLLDRWLEERARLPVFLLIEGALLLLAPLAAGPFEMHDPNAVPALVCGSLAASAMGFQNAMMRLRLPDLPSTTVMTTNVTQGLVDAVSVLLPVRDVASQRKREEAHGRIARLWPQIAWFTLGAAGGALAYKLFGLASLILPALVCDVLAWRINRL
jgi:uncharacterized membrane protein YoaK (UPF0700 family)